MHDVLIVGGGPAGATLALALSRGDIDLRIVDARPAGGLGIGDRTLALAHTARLLFERIGVWSKLSSITDTVVDAVARSRCARSAIRPRFSRPVSSSSIAENCPVTPIAARTPPGSRRTSKPPTRISPSPGVSSVERMLTMVVLPAPLGPRSA